MSQAKVIAAEQVKPSSVRSTAGETVVTYDSIQEGGLPSQLLYFFVNDKLVRARYVLSAGHDHPDGFIADFKTLQSALREKHGKPLTDRALWEDDDRQIERAAYLNQDRATTADLLPSDPLLGETLAAGHLKLLVEWENDRTQVIHGLAAVGGRVVHQIEYRSATPR